MNDDLDILLLLGFSLGWFCRELLLHWQMRQAYKKIEAAVREAGGDLDSIVARAQEAGTDSVHSVAIKLNHNIIQDNHYFFAVNPSSGEEEFVCQGTSLEAAAARLVELFGPEVQAVFKHETQGIRYLMQAGRVEALE